MHKIKHKAIWLLFAAYLVFLIVLHRQVFLYFDDYGYASLSYGYNVGTSGLHYGFGDILKFLGWHYFNWGGRILYFFFEICSLKLGLEFMQHLQALIIWGIGFVSYLLVKEDEKNDFYKATVIVFMFGTLGLLVLNKGVFWFTAAVLYVWPLLPLFILVYIRRNLNTSNRVMVVCGVVIAFLASFSYEQIAVLTSTYMVVSFVIDRVRGRWKKHEWGMLVAAIVGAMLELLAPGNFVRSATSRYDEFNSLSIFGKISQNLPEILEINFGRDNKFFVIPLVLAGLLAVWYCWDRNRKSIARLWGNMAVYLFFSSMLFLMWGMEVPMFVSNSCRIIWVVLFSFHMIVMLWKMARFDLAALFIGGLCSEGMMLVAPTIPERCMLPFDFVVIIVAAAAMGVEVRQGINIGKIAIVCVAGILGIINMSDIASGYHDNLAINVINDSKLREKSMRIAAGEDIDTIVLYKLLDDAYAADMPYQQSYMEYWMKYYYEIPQSVSFVWGDIDEIGPVREVVMCDIPVIRSIYPEMIDETTQYNEDGSLNIGVTPEVMSDNLQIMINGEVYNTVIDRGFVSTCVPKEVLGGDSLEISLFDQASGIISDSVIWMERDDTK